MPYIWIILQNIVFERRKKKSVYGTLCKDIWSQILYRRAVYEIGCLHKCRKYKNKKKTRQAKSFLGVLFAWENAADEKTKKDARKNEGKEHSKRAFIASRILSRKKDKKFSIG